MKTIISLAVAILLFHSAISQISPFQKDSLMLRSMEYQWLTAEFKLDTATISKMMDDAFISIGDNSISNKHQELAGTYKNISQRLQNGHIVDSLYLDDFTIRIYGATAIVTYISVTKGRIKNVPFADRRTRIYDVWIKKNDQWKAMSSQITPIH